MYADQPCECKHLTQADFPTEKLFWEFSTKQHFGELDERIGNFKAKSSSMQYTSIVAIPSFMR